MSVNEICCTFSNKGTRNEVRMRVVNKFSQENPGLGSGEDASKYKYFVETLETGDRVYLQRPANLHNGFDFLVCVENMDYSEPGKRKRNFPKHTDFGKDLQIKKDENPEMYKKLYDLLHKVFSCEDVSDNEIEALTFKKGYPVDQIVKTMKWLFIEQDIRYWNYSGRNMTWGVVPPKE
ncbi:DNA adenine methylase [uncultured Streptococcus sp.]|uniref:DNA adenine methylase n=1 Tax=uncultured Streptococcus sp. TaxID=83427 RepID=UPI0025E442CB|nr:DNA adenine methylase [uncultured Streptococcus sp.]